MASVVETGSRRTDASATHPAAPQMAASVKAAEGRTETMPFVKSLSIRAAKRPESIVPASVVTAPQTMAVR
jgi:hypothetical protein